MEIHSIQEYLSLIESLKAKYTFTEPSFSRLLLGMVHLPHFIYRGHSNHAEYKLIPGIFRWHKNNESIWQANFSQAEHNILYDFTSEACKYIKDVHVDDIKSWLEIAQHFAVPTRLLDFTETRLSLFTLHVLGLKIRMALFGF